MKGRANFFRDPCRWRSHRSPEIFEGLGKGLFPSQLFARPGPLPGPETSFSMPYSFGSTSLGEPAPMRRLARPAQRCAPHPLAIRHPTPRIAPAGTRIGPAVGDSDGSKDRVPGPPEPSDELTRLLREGTHEEVMRDLFPIVYGELRAIAGQRMRRERGGHTLQATALVHEAFLRLAGSHRGWDDRARFFAAASEAMRRILVDHARHVGSLRAGGAALRITMSGFDVAEERDPARVLALDEALTRLEALDARAAEVARLRLFAGLETGEIADALGVSQRTAQREWAFASARLMQALEGEA